MREKAEQGIYPSRPPFGYRNNRNERTIEVDPDKAPILRKMFEMYAAGGISLAKLGKFISDEFGIRHPKSYLEKILKNPFYTGIFIWDGKTYKGTHFPLVSSELFLRVQAAFKGHNHPKYRQHNFAYSGLLRCAYDDCTITAEVKKEKYVYYHCTGYRGKCELPYFREEDLGNRLAQILKNIHVPDNVLSQLEKAIFNDQAGFESRKAEDRERLNRRLAEIQNRMDRAYTDRLDGKISDDFWERKNQEWRDQEQRLILGIKALDEAKQGRCLDSLKILELANKAHFLYLRQDPTERAKLLKIVLSNCKIDSASVYPTYRKPFDLIPGAAKTGEWYARRDSNSRPLAS